MRKRALLFVMTLVLSLLLMTGCVAQADYDAVVAERDSIQAQLTSTVAERDKARAQVTSTAAERDKARTQVSSLKNELDELKASLEETQTALDAAKADGEAFKSDVSSIFAELEKKTEAAEMIQRFWSNALKVEAGKMSQRDLEVKVALFMAGLSGKLEPIGNAELSQTWQDAVVASTRGDEKGFAAKFAAVMDSLSDLIDEDVSAMNAKLR